MALDPIEAEMASGADVVYREKLVSRVVAGAGLGLAALAAVATIGATHNGEIGAGGAVIGAVVATAFLLFGIVTSVARIAVTRREIRVVAAGRGRKIPLSAITSAALQSYRGGPPVAVTVEWTIDDDDDAFSIPSSDPKALLAAIEGARGRIRVAVPAGAGEPTDSVVEGEKPQDEDEQVEDASAQAR